MENVKGFFILILLATFPVAVYSLQSWKSLDIEMPEWTTAKKVEAERVDLIKVVDTKLKDIADVDVKILSAQGELLQYQDQRQSLIKELEKLQERIKPYVRQAKK